MICKQHSYTGKYPCPSCASGEGKTFMGEPAIQKTVPVSRELIHKLHRAAGCSGNMTFDEVVQAALGRLLAQSVASEPVAWCFIHSDDSVNDISMTEHSKGMTPPYRHPPAPAVPEGWIPVSERLPEIGNEVLVYCPHKIEFGRNPVTALMRLIRYEKATEFYWDNNYGGRNVHLKESVTHWMSLPAAPQPTEGSTDE